MPKKPKPLTDSQRSWLNRIRIDIDNRSRAIEKHQADLVKRNLEIHLMKTKMANELGGTWVSDTLYDPKGNAINQL